MKSLSDDNVIECGTCPTLKKIEVIKPYKSIHINYIK